MLLQPSKHIKSLMAHFIPRHSGWMTSSRKDRTQSTVPTYMGFPKLVHFSRYRYSSPKRLCVQTTFIL
jgi:hypothetical protein